MNPAIQFDRVRKQYAAAWRATGTAPRNAVQDVSFTVPQGALFGLVGVNGAGKSTLIKCLLDLTAADAGLIQIFGRDSREATARAGLAFLPERFTPPHYLVADAYLRLMLQLANVTWNEPWIADCFAQLGLVPAARQRPVRALSKGMTQKLGLAAAFLSEPRLLVLDEPMSGLDPRARAEVKNALRAAQARGVTVLFTSHALADVDELCDHMAVLDQGVLKFCGAPTELIAHQSSARNLEQAFLALIDASPPPPTLH